MVPLKMSMKLRCRRQSTLQGHISSKATDLEARGYHYKNLLHVNIARGPVGIPIFVFLLLKWCPHNAARQGSGRSYGTGVP